MAQDELNSTLNNMAAFLIDIGRPEEGDALCREAIEKLEELRYQGTIRSQRISRKASSCRI